MNYATDIEHLTGSTSTFQGYKYDWFTDEILEWVRSPEVSEEDAVKNLYRIMREYERRKSFTQKFKSEQFLEKKLAELNLNE